MGSAEELFGHCFLSFDLCDARASLQQGAGTTSWANVHEPTLIGQKERMWQQIYPNWITAVVGARNGTELHLISLYHGQTRALSRKAVPSFLAAWTVRGEDTCWIFPSDKSDQSISWVLWWGVLSIKKQEKYCLDFGERNANRWAYRSVHFYKSWG